MCGRIQVVLTWVIFSIDICQFSVSSLFNSSEDKSRSISFRSIILIMIYAGTIILNLLAASVDNKFPAMKNQSSENSTLTELMDDLAKDNPVRTCCLMIYWNRDDWFNQLCLCRKPMRWSTCGTRCQSHEASVLSWDGSWYHRWTLIYSTTRSLRWTNIMYIPKQQAADKKAFVNMFNAQCVIFIVEVFLGRIFL